MRKIINGKRYNTESAKFIGYTQYSHPGDFAYWRVELYQKITGEFFIYGEGGPMSSYARTTGQNETSGSEEIRPLTLQEARKWAEKYLDGDVVEETFGIIEKGKSQIATWIPEGTKALADELRQKGYTLADIFEAGGKALDKE